MITAYRNIPELLSPTAFPVGSFSIRWYSLMYVAGLFFVAALSCWRIWRGEDKDLLPKTSRKKKCLMIWDVLLVGTIGMLLGGRIGYVLFYGFAYYVKNPLAIFFPLDAAGISFSGIYGMSYFGALAGILIAGYIYLRKKKIYFWKMADFIVPSAAGAYFFGRIGNFINGELFGRKTDFFLGMRFNGESFLRHPSQLYEAFFEGILLFLILWPIRNKARFDGQLLLIYLTMYSFFRIVLEFFREPGPGELVFGGFVTKGQVLAFMVAIFSTLAYSIKKKKVL